MHRKFLTPATAEAGKFCALPVVKLSVKNHSGDYFRVHQRTKPTASALTLRKMDIWIIANAEHLDLFVADSEKLPFKIPPTLEIRPKGKNNIELQLTGAYSAGVLEMVRSVYVHHSHFEESMVECRG